MTDGDGQPDAPVVDGERPDGPAAGDGDGDGDGERPYGPEATPALLHHRRSVEEASDQAFGDQWSTLHDDCVGYVRAVAG
ncbi:hypothetical protein GCM10023176_28560 [Micromonospora coerulea]|uniref:Uncharacterized protein n=1 Tax=Micromonospora coerulea TaxID=47856 RepID=A0ABP8SLU9_9ACTN